MSGRRKSCWNWSLRRRKTKRNYWNGNLRRKTKRS
jgi:hypothetical protein